MTDNNKNTDKRPNFLYLFADQLRYDCLGCMGNDIIHTPNLDALAKRGTLYKQSYSNAPVCTPYRAALFTGQYGSETGITHNCGPLPTCNPRLAETLNDADYRTSYVGKWHLGDTGNKAVPAELNGGFQEFTGYQCYNDFLHNVCFWDEEGEKRRFFKHRTNATSDLAIERLNALHKRDEPFALFVSYQAPHYPVTPDPEYLALYKDVEFEMPPNYQEVNPYTPTFSPRSAHPNYEADPVYQRYGGDMQEYLRHYYGLVTQLDFQVGRVLAELDILGIADNTFICFHSDHGEMQGAHGATADYGYYKGTLNKGVPQEESARVPHIMVAPQQSAELQGTVINTPVSGVDFYPTICDYAGITIPEHCSGTSLRALHEHKTEEHADVFSELKDWASIRRGPYKYVFKKEDLTPIYMVNIDEDLYELNNLVGKEEYQDIQKELHEALSAWLTNCQETYAREQGDAIAV